MLQRVKGGAKARRENARRRQFGLWEFPPPVSPTLKEKRSRKKGDNRKQELDRIRSLESWEKSLGMQAVVRREKLGL